MYTRHIAVSVGAVALAVPLLLLPGTASAVPQPGQVNTACPSPTPGVESDCLQVIITTTTAGITTTDTESRSLIEVPGESVTSEIAIEIAQTNAFDPFNPSTPNTNAAFLVEPGTLTGNTLGSLVEGAQSDEVHFNVSQNPGPPGLPAGTTLHFTIRSDELGRGNNVFGFVETGNLQNVTCILFPGASCVGTPPASGVATVGGHTIVVQVRSDVGEVPEPASLLLLGSGLAGLGLWRRARKGPQA